MKKFLSLFITFILLLSSFSLYASAESAALSLSSAEGFVGEEVSVELSLSGNQGLVSLCAALEFDSDILELVNITDTELLKGKNFSGNTLEWTDSQEAHDNASNGIIAKLVFKIKETAALGETAISVNFISSKKADSSDNSFESASSKIKIVCAEHIFGEWTETETPDCEKVGSKERVCEKCGKKETEELAKLDHNYGEWTVLEQATCSKAGKKERVCLDCQHKDQQEIDALPHTFGDWAIKTEATCEEAGEQTRTCSVCDEKEQQVTAALGHSFLRWTVKTSATCTEKGTDERKCETCGKTETRQTKPAGHSFKDPVLVKEATAYSEGILEGECEVCGQKTSQTLPCGITDEKNGVVIETTVGIFDKNIKLSVKCPNEKSDDYTVAAEALKDVARNLKLYRIEALNNDLAMDPNGEVEITITLPTGFNDESQLYLIEEGKFKKIDFDISLGYDKISFKTEKLGLFALCNSGTLDIDNDSADSQKSVGINKGAMTAIIIISIVIVLLGGALVFLLILSKKYKTFR